MRGAGVGVGTDAVQIDAGSAGGAHPDIVVTATSPGLVMGRVVIPASADAGAHAVLAVAAQAASDPRGLTFD